MWKETLGERLPLFLLSSPVVLLPPPILHSVKWSSQWKRNSVIHTQPFDSSQSSTCRIFHQKFPTTRVSNSSNPAELGTFNGILYQLSEIWTRWKTIYSADSNKFNLAGINQKIKSIELSQKRVFWPKKCTTCCAGIESLIEFCFIQLTGIFITTNKIHSAAYCFSLHLSDILNFC